jgi:hypothetical protein
VLADAQRMVAQGLMQTRNILRRSPRHGDGKTLDGSFVESGAWATVLDPLKYKIPEPKLPVNRSSFARSGSPDVTTASLASVDPPSPPSDPEQLNDVLTQVCVCV